MRPPRYPYQAAAQTDLPAPAGDTPICTGKPVLFVTTSFPLHENSSSGTFIRALVDALGRYCPLKVLTPADRTPDARKDCGSHCTVHAFRYAPRRWQILAHQPGGIPAALRRQPLLYLLLTTFLSRMLIAILLDGRKAALLHANWSITGVLAGVAGAVLEVPVVTTLRGTDVALATRSRPFRFLLKACIRLSTAVVTVSDAMALTARQLVPQHAAKITTIPNGASEQLLAIRQRTRQPSEQLQLVCIGNLTPNKAIDTVIEAVHQLRDHTTLQLRIVGDGPERESLESRVRQLDLGSTIRFEGTLPPDEIPGVLETADVLILASRSEGRPNVVLEAMAAGRTVIASNIEGTRELIENEHTGLLFPTGDSGALAGQIQRVAADPDLSRHLAAAARQAILERDLTWSGTAQRYFQLYTELTATTQTRPTGD